MWLGGCSSEDTSTAPSPSPSSSGSPSPTAAQSFNQPLVSQKGSKDKAGKEEKGTASTTLSVPGLLKSTNPSELARQVQAQIKSGKTAASDPFASLAPLISFKTPIVPVSPDSQAASQKTELPSLPAFPKVPEMPRVSLPSVPLSPGKPVAKLPKPGLPTLPSIPEPTLAQAVEVTGVVTVGGVTQAIVKAPNEPTSRYVSAGQRLSNGQILVKRIEVFSGSDPVVVLEENGIEVPRTVGSKAAPSPSGRPA